MKRIEPFFGVTRYFSSQNCDNRNYSFSLRDIGSGSSHTLVSNDGKIGHIMDNYYYRIRNINGTQVCKTYRHSGRAFDALTYRSYYTIFCSNFDIQQERYLPRRVNFVPVGDLDCDLDANVRFE